MSEYDLVNKLVSYFEGRGATVHEKGGMKPFVMIGADNGDKRHRHFAFETDICLYELARTIVDKDW